MMRLTMVGQTSFQYGPIRKKDQCLLMIPKWPVRSKYEHPRHPKENQDEHFKAIAPV